MDKLKQLMSDIDDLIKASEEKENKMLDKDDVDYGKLAVEAARRNGYLKCKNLIYKYL